MKLKDFTLGMVHEICINNDCPGCPLFTRNIKDADKKFTGCAARGLSVYTEEVFWNYEIRGFNDT